jgi:hypothetical protein
LRFKATTAGQPRMRVSEMRSSLKHSTPLRNGLCERRAE